jgi:hypothetical protein
MFRKQPEKSDRVFGNLLDVDWMAKNMLLWIVPAAA